MQISLSHEGSGSRRSSAQCKAISCSVFFIAQKFPFLLKLLRLRIHGIVHRRSNVSRCSSILAWVVQQACMYAGYTGSLGLYDLCVDGGGEKGHDRYWSASPSFVSLLMQGAV